MKWDIKMKIFTLEVGYIGTNCYVVVNGDNEAVVIDPGDEAGKIRDFLKENNFTLKMIFLTHGHFDHIGAVSELKNEFSVPVYIHPDDYEMAKDPLKNESRNFGGPEVFCVPDKFYNDKDIIPFGSESFEVMATPGHSEGSVSLITGDNIFTGDTLFAGSIGRTDLYKGNYSVLACSLKKFLDIEKDFNIFPGHGEATSLSYEKRLNPFLRLF